VAHRAFKEQLYAQLARIGKALASPQRLELLDLLAQGERTVEDLAHEAALSIANASQHLQVLRQAHLVETRKEGVYVYYRLADQSVYQFWRSLRLVGERQLSEIDRLVDTFMRHPDHLEPVARDDLATRLAKGDVVVVDVRPRSEYRQGHITHALSVPVDELHARLAELPATRDIVAYCRGPYCLFADEAVAILRAHGIPASRYVEGYPEWAAAGLPTSRDDPVSSIPGGPSLPSPR
jgi:DNA-binding transcriptional ArsR family regulator